MLVAIEIACDSNTRTSRKVERKSLRGQSEASFVGEAKKWIGGRGVAWNSVVGWRGLISNMGQASQSFLSKYDPVKLSGQGLLEPGRGTKGDRKGL